MGRFQVIAISTLGLANAADAIEVLCIGFILPALDPSWNVSGPEQGVLSAAVFAGMLVGGLAGGALADAMGRRAALALALVVNLVFALVAAAAPNWGVLAAARALAGIGVGASVPPVFTLANELLPPQSRGFWLSLIAWAWTFGQVLTAGLAWLLIGKFALSWRIFAAAAAAPSAIALVSLIFAVTESPRFLASKGRLDEAAAVIARIARVNGRGGRELPSLRPLAAQATDAVAAGGAVIASHGLASGAELVRMPSRTGLLLGTAAAANEKLQLSASSGVSPGSGAASPSGTRGGSPKVADVAIGVAAAGATAPSLGERSPLLQSSQLPLVLGGSEAAEAGSAVGFDAGKGNSKRQDAASESVPLVLAASSTAQVVPADDADGTVGVPASASRLHHCSTAIRSFCRATGRRGATLFSPSLIRGTVCMLCVWAVLSLAWYGLGVWLPTVLSASGLAVSPYADAFIAAAAAVPGNAAASWLLDRAPRRLLLAGSMLATGACVVGVALGRSEAAVLTASCFMNAVSVIAWACTNVLSTEVFPTSVRSSGLGLLSATGRAGSIAGQLLFGHLVQKSATALLVAVASLLAAGVAAALLLPRAPVVAAPVPADVDRGAGYRGSAEHEHEHEHGTAAPAQTGSATASGGLRV